jgi:hypothetical protein
MARIAVAVVRPLRSNQVSEYLGHRTWYIGCAMAAKTFLDWWINGMVGTKRERKRYLAYNEKGIRAIDGKGLHGACIADPGG